MCEIRFRPSAKSLATTKRSTPFAKADFFKFASSFNLQPWTKDAMNAQQAQAFPAPPGLHRSSGPPRSLLESGPDRGDPRVPPIERRFSPPIPVHGHHVGARNPWPRLPGICRRRVQGVASLGHSIVAWGATAVMVAISAAGVAVHLMRDQVGPLVVHLVWPV